MLADTDFWSYYLYQNKGKSNMFAAGQLAPQCEVCNNENMISKEMLPEGKLSLYDFDQHLPTVKNETTV